MAAPIYPRKKNVPNLLQKSHATSTQHNHSYARPYASKLALIYRNTHNWTNCILNSKITNTSHTSFIVIVCAPHTPAQYPWCITINYNEKKMCIKRVRSTFCGLVGTSENILHAIAIVPPFFHIKCNQFTIPYGINVDMYAYTSIISLYIINLVLCMLPLCGT